jgi:NADPH:quinone reductase-like Zn-dependent oxidoreductase
MPGRLSGRASSRCQQLVCPAPDLGPGADIDPADARYPVGYLPAGVRLTAYGGDATDLPREALQGILDAIAEGRLQVAVHHVYAGLDQVARAHADMEANAAVGKLVVRL